MKLTDYIIQFLSEHQVSDIYGYPGGCINHLIDSAFKSKNVRAHLAYHEQGAAFAACGYAQKSHKLGVAYSTSGPGALNLVTGIASAYFDYIPCLFITGQVDSPAEKGDRKLRQRGFQETDVVSCVKNITKWAYHLECAEDIRWCLEKAYDIAFHGSPGPVLLDIPNDLQRADVDVATLKGYQTEKDKEEIPTWDISDIVNEIKAAEKPLILAGNGVKQGDLSEALIKLAEKIDAPVVTSMSAFDLLPYTHNLNFGFIGTNGHRYANFITEKADLVLVFGNRMSVRPMGTKREAFAPNAKLIRIDADPEQLNYKVREDEMDIPADAGLIFDELLKYCDEEKHAEWLAVCNRIKKSLLSSDQTYPCEMMSEVSEIVPDTYDISSDIGQNIVWLAQSYHIKKGQTVCMSAGNSPMGYSIPASIGAYYAGKRPVLAFCGDGGLMMNVQELQFIKREQIPNKIICMNNSALGMIRSWQARYMDSYSQTTSDSGYDAPNLKKIAEAFDLKYTFIEKPEDLKKIRFEENRAELIEIRIPTEVETMPGGNMHDQSPLISRELYDEIMEL